MSPEAAAPRLLLANLDAEAELSGQPLPQSARHSAAAFGSLLRVLAQPGDRLHLLAALESHRMTEVPGLPRPQLCFGEDLRQASGRDPSRPAAPLPSALLAWCETPAVAALRRHVAAPSPPPPGLPVHQLLWHLEAPPAEVVQSAHHRAFHLAMAHQLGCALPGAQLLHSTTDLEQHLARGGAEASREGAWVLKVPFSATGRGRLWGTGSRLDTITRRRAERLFRRGGELLFEPWMERTVDFAMAGVLTPTGPLYLGLHRQLVDSRGAFQGVEFCCGRQEVESLDPRMVRQLRGVFDAVAKALADLGFRGPFGIDGWCHRDHRGALVLHPLGEINARLTFGIVARLLAERLSDSLGLVPGQTLRLRLGRIHGEHTSAPASRGGTSYRLLEPDAQGNGAATLDLGPQPPAPALEPSTPSLGRRHPNE